MDDEVIVAESVRAMLQELGYVTSGIAAAKAAALRAVEADRPDLVLMDINLGDDQEGIAAAEIIRERHHLPVVYVTAYADEATLNRAKITHPFGYVVKPFDERDLRVAIEIALHNHQLEERLRRSEEALRESERRQRAILDNIADPAWLKDREGRFQAVNRAWCKFFGLEPARVIGKTGAEFLPTALSAELEEQDRGVMTSGVEWRAEERVPDGRQGWAWFETYKAPLRNEREEVVGTVGIARDITERKRAEDALRHFAAIVQSSDDAIIGKDLDGKVLSWNPAAERIYGYPAAEIVGRSIALLIPADRGEELPAMMAKLRCGESVKHFETIRVRKNGQRIHVSVTVSPLNDAGGRVVGASTIARDITERIRLEAEREKARADYQTLFSKMIDGFALHELLCDAAGQPVDYRFLAINPAFEKLTGLTAGAVLGRTVKEVLPQTEPFWIETYGRVALTGETAFFEHTSAALDRCFEISAFCPERGKFACVFVDVTDRKRAEDRLLESERRLRMALEAAGAGMWDWDLRTGRIIWSEQHARLFGLKPEEFDGRYETCRRCLHADDVAGVEAAVAQARASRTEYQREYRVRWPDGSEHWILARGHFRFDARGEPFRMLGVVQDFTQRKQLEAQFHQAQKMEAVGQLAGGVAHDFNNILAATLMNLSLVEKDPHLTAGMRESIRELARDTKRAASLTRQLLLFSRRQIAQHKTLDLNEVLDNLLKMLRRLLGENIDLSFRPAPTPLWIEADPGMMEQVVMNLCVNARDAMPKGGRLSLGTQRTEVDAAHAERNPEARVGAFALLMVEDEGTGMDEATLKRIFEPFYTTKEVGKGTGLGLATVYGIIKQHEGWVEVASQVGQGTVFRVYLPLAREPARAPAVAADESRRVGGSEGILLVEDEPSVRCTTAAFLRQLGYTVWEAGNGVEALRLWGQFRHRIRLLFTDMVMPEGVTGLDLAEQLRAQAPGLRIIISSGYSVELLGQGGRTATGITYLPKPCEPEALARQLRECLESPRDPAPGG